MQMSHVMRLKKNLFQHQQNVAVTTKDVDPGAKATFLAKNVHL
jgi:hypothetical protein